MSGLLYLLLLFPFSIPFVVKFFSKGKVTYLELAICAFLVILSGSATYYAGTYSSMRDTEVHNGLVSEKHPERYTCYVNGSNGCRHYYSCHPHEVCSGSGKDRSCHTEWDSCPDYDWEQDWMAETSIGEYNLDRGDRRGIVPSEKWNRTYINEPVSDTFSYTNYIKAAPDSLFNDSKIGLSKKVLQSVPKYPATIYDTWKINRVVSVGFELPNPQQWQDKLQLLLGQLGPSKQVNMVVMFYKGQDRAIKNAVKVSWLGGKKNDAVLLVGLDPENKIDWVDVFSWSKNGVFDVQLRDDIQSLGLIDFQKPDSVIEVARKDITDLYVRRPMSEFEYLKKEIEPPLWVIILTLVVSIGVACGTSWFAQVNEFTEQGRY